jgi:hypothetical protein
MRYMCRLKLLLVSILLICSLVLTNTTSTVLSKSPSAKMISPTIASTSSITINRAIVVPTDISKIDYPTIFNSPNIVKASINDPYSLVERSEIAYPVEYLGVYQYPMVSGSPLPTEIARVVGLHDAKIPSPDAEAVTNYDYEAARALEKEGFRVMLKRARSLGAEEVTFTNYLQFKNFTTAELKPLDTAGVSYQDMSFIAENAQKLDLNMTLCLNLAMDGGNPWDYPIPNSIWLATLINNWGSFVLNQAQLCEEKGIDALMINHFDWQPYIMGYEDVYQKEMMALISKVKTIYHGKILLMVEPIQGANISRLSVLLSSVDGYTYNLISRPLQYAENKAVDVSNLKKLYVENLRQTGSQLRSFNKPYLVRVLIQSENMFLENGWHEDMFPVPWGSENYTQMYLKPDFSVQAIAYEAILEAVKQVQTEGSMRIGGFETTGYYYMETLIPYISQPQISQSIRDKPAEAIVFQWFKQSHQLTIQNPEGSGATEPTTGTYTYDSQEAIHIKAEAKAGWHFDHWVIDGVEAGFEASIDVLMGAEHEVKAIFAPGSLGDLNITVKGDDGAPINSASVASTIQPKGRTALNGLSDINGSIILRGVYPGVYSLQAQKNGYKATTQSTNVTLTGVTELTIILQALPTTGGLRVYTKDQNGATIPGVKIIVVSQQSGLAVQNGISSLNGTIIINNLPPDSYTLQASKDEFYPATGTASILVGVTGEVALVLQALPTTGGLRVVVKSSSGDTIQGAAVSSVSQPVGQTPLSGVSGADGSVTFSDLKPGSFTLQVTKDGYVTKSGTATVVAGDMGSISLALQGQQNGVPGYPLEAVMLVFFLAAILMWTRSVRSK